ncbi:hypothetical protein MKQ70_36055 [Chitinophaga sedimenti]|nr:hypothetical protein [Chitinophaga sedimenti]MCK7560049.1 hypothetical protein [Chitinophaga sedimenti]
MLPTLAHVAGDKQSLPANIEGIDMWAHLSGQQKVMPERVLYYLSAQGKLEAVRKGDWKLRVTTITELFDLKNDISERHNLAEREATKVKELQRLMAAYPKE